MPSSVNFFAILAGLNPCINKANTLFIIFAADSSIIHLFLSFSSFLYPKGGFVVKGN